jgi:hypothetical protein
MTEVFSMKKRGRPRKKAGEKKAVKKKAGAWNKALWLAEAQNFELAENEHYRRAEELYRQLLEAESDSKKGLQYITMIEHHLKRLKAKKDEAGLRAFVSFFVARGIESSSLIETLLRISDLSDWAKRIPLPKKKRP